MPFSIMLHTVCKHYAVQYHAKSSTQALCRSISCCIQYASIIPFNIMLHTALCRSISCCIQYILLFKSSLCHLQYHAAYSMQALCHLISCCIQYASIMPFNIMLHTVSKHYAIQYHAAYSTQALCHSISCCIQYKHYPI